MRYHYVMAGIAFAGMLVGILTAILGILWRVNQQDHAAIESKVDALDQRITRRLDRGTAVMDELRTEQKIQGKTLARIEGALRP